jgi:adenine-specific DNA methylase
MESYVRRLIEVDLPIRVISEHARREKYTHSGHISTSHVWWARRPLAACRAVLLGTLLPDPADEGCPEDFRKRAREALAWMRSRDLSEPLALREALLKFIGDFAAWERSSEQRWVDTARTLVKAAHPDGPPLLLDPFAGGGAIPVEALRLGGEAFANELNPVAVLILKTLLEDMPRYGQRLTDAVKRWGEWVRKRAYEQLKEAYPADPDGSVPIAYIWARTIKCEGPACGAQVPLIRQFWLRKRGKRLIALKVLPNKPMARVDFAIVEVTAEREVQRGTVRGGSATCPLCGYTTRGERLRMQLAQRNGGASDARLIAVVTTSKERVGRKYRHL